MCQSELTKADIRAICKNRGFSSKKASSLRVFENFLLSDTGVAEAIGTLSREEIILLHLLRFTDKLVNVSFFERIYRPEEGTRWRGDTFTQQYNDVFRQVRISFIRRGLLLFAEERNYSRKKAKLEKLRFCFPKEFHKFLPRLSEKPRTLSGPGNINTSAVREKLLEIIGKSCSVQKTYPLNIRDGELRIGQEEFSVRKLSDWQKAGWSASLAKREKRIYHLPPSGRIYPSDAVIYALSQLGNHEWGPHDELLPILKIFSFTYDQESFDTGDICQKGWEWGCLARRKAGGRICYRLAECDSDSETDIPENYLKVNKNREILVSLKTVPCQKLEYLAKICDFEVTNSQLTASPNIIRIGRNFKDIRDDPLTRWLMEHVSVFRKAFEKSEKEWGKRIIHQDILMAKVNDLTLKVAIEKSFSDPGRIIFLPNNFIAFPRGVLREIESLIKKSGYVIKRVEANE